MATLTPEQILFFQEQGYALSHQPLFAPEKFAELQAIFEEQLALKGALLSEAQRAAGVIAASAGNHAEGVAFAAARLGLRARIVMPQTTPSIKVSAVRALAGWGEVERRNGIDHR